MLPEGYSSLNAKEIYNQALRDRSFWLLLCLRKVELALFCSEMKSKRDENFDLSNGHLALNS